MHAFNVQLADQNRAYVLGSSRNLFRILRNIPTVVGITRRGHGCECRIYARLIVIDLCIGTKSCCGRGG